jgi:hypothetical protein
MTRIITEHFNSIRDLALEIRTTERLDDAHNASERAPDKFTDFMSLDETLAICVEKRGFYEKSANSIHDILIDQPQKTLSTIRTRRPSRTYAGSRPHIAASIAGANKAFIRSTKKDRFKPVIKICVPITGAASVEAKAFFYRGAAILSAVKALEQQGEQVQLDIALLVKGNYDKHLQYQLLTTIKQSQKRINAADIGFALTHCNMTRRIMFGVMERRKELTQETNQAYGKPGNPDLLKDKYNLVLPIIDNSYCTQAIADRNIQKQFNTLHNNTPEAA